MITGLLHAKECGQAIIYLEKQTFMKSIQHIINTCSRLLFYMALNPEDSVEEIDRVGTTSSGTISGEIKITTIPKYRNVIIIVRRRWFIRKRYKVNY